MSNKNLFKEAIADAKAVREAALANAKAALEEALTPKLQSMLAAKLNEMEYEREEESHMGEKEMEEGFTTAHGDDSDENLDFNLEENDELEEDFDLSEILAELDEENPLKEAKKKEEEESEEEESEEESISSMSKEELTDLIKDIITQEMGNEGGEDHMELDADNAGGPSDNDADNEIDEINLDELLAELYALGEGEDDVQDEGLGDMLKKGARTVGSAIKKGYETVISNPAKCSAEGAVVFKAEKAKGMSDEKAGEERDIAINACREKAGLGPITSHKQGQAFGSNVTEEMQEAISVINTLRNELNEVNLLNAKLLYVNKIFKAKNLSESQKLKVIASFDKATTAKEAKVVFESLNANLTATAPKQAIKESLGFASRAAGVAPRKAIVETNDAITRMQKLANIIK
jgi:hypothetical protein